MRFPLILAWLCALPTLAVAQLATDEVTTEHMRARLVAHAPDGLAAGKPMWLGLQLTHAPRWHSYWKNPGDSGLPTTLRWQLPAGVEAGEIQWPTPKQLPIGPLLNYGYEGVVLLPVALTVPADFNANTLDVKLRAEWLVCDDVCIPESGDFALKLPATASTATHGAQFAAALASVPKPLAQASAKARVEGQALVVDIDGLPWAAARPTLKFFAETTGVIEYPGPLVQRWDGARWSARVPLSSQRSESPAVLQAVLVGDQPVGVQVRVDVAGPWPPVSATPVAAEAFAPADTEPTSLPVVLVLALLGGVLLNLMPCVFPILSLKVLGFAQSGQGYGAPSPMGTSDDPPGGSGPAWERPGARPERRHLLTGGLAYTAGVVLTFAALAGLLLALRAGGEQLGWGFQLQSPPFIAALAVLFTLIGLNLAGVFEFSGVLPGNLAALRARHPVLDHALTGALAVAVASPCTGPFMGAALGAALVLPPVQALSVFVALGIGMALPYLALSAWPGLASRLPKPGVWMARFKALMAFPMFATVVWLVWVLGQQVGIDGASALLGVLLAVAFAAWAFGTAGFGPRARWGFGSVALVALAGTLAWATPGLVEPQAAPASQSAQSGWQPWSSEAVANARAAGRPVFVDFTAAWCVTCQYNKRTVLTDPSVVADFEAQNVLLLRADWTRRDPLITQELARLKRSGVPVYVLYAPGNGAPLLLPEILRVDPLRDAIATLKSGV